MVEDDINFGSGFDDGAAVKKYIAGVMVYGSQSLYEFFFSSLSLILLANCGSY